MHKYLWFQLINYLFKWYSLFNWSWGNIRGISSNQILKYACSKIQLNNYKLRVHIFEWSQYEDKIEMCDIYQQKGFQNINKIHLCSLVPYYFQDMENHLTPWWYGCVRQHVSVNYSGVVELDCGNNTQVGMYEDLLSHANLGSQPASSQPFLHWQIIIVVKMLKMELFQHFYVQPQPFSYNWTLLAFWWW